MKKEKEKIRMIHLSYNDISSKNIGEIVPSCQGKKLTANLEGIGGEE